MKPACSAHAAALQARWERIGLGVRCAYNPARPEVLQHYVQGARLLSRLQPQREAHIQRRMLELLLRTAEDEALPWTWRAVCLEHLAWPLARLTSLLSRQAASAQEVAALEDRAQRASSLLGLPPQNGTSARRAAANSSGHA
jgi:hypothetical protein